MGKGSYAALELLRRRAPGEVLTYGFVMDCLHEYKSPRSKLTRLLQAGALLCVKKGFYVFGPLFRRSALASEALANLLYGPSYLSLQWALQYYRLIPEAVEEFTSVTFKKKKLFDTPVGRFSYSHCYPKIYPVGVTQINDSEYQRMLIATPEKALADVLLIQRGKIAKTSELESILYDDLRIESEDLLRLDLELLKQIHQAYPHSTLYHLIKFLTRLAK